MKIFENRPRLLRTLKITGFVVLALIALIALVVFISVFNSRNYFGLSSDRGMTNESSLSSPSFGYPGYGGAPNSVSENRLVPGGAPPGSGDSVIVDAEEFEVVNYRAEIRTNNIDRTCSVISDLKPLSHIIFENAHEGMSSCYYTFKVERGRVEEVLSVIKGLNPRSLSEDTRTIRRELSDYESQRDILESKIAAIDETLSSALTAYEEITRIASQSSDATSLTRVVTSRIEIIERLTNERLALAGQMDRILRSEREALERIDYIQFDVRIFESKYFDGERLADSWRDALRTFFNNANQMLQNVTLGVVSFVLFILPLVLYAFIIIFALKYIIRFAKYIWKR